MNAQKNRENIDSAFSKGSELMEWGDYLEALDRFLQVYEIDPTREENLENLTYCYYCADNESQLIKFAGKLTELDTGNAHGEYYLGRYYHEKGQNQDALTHLLNALKISPNDSDSLTLAGRCYMYLNDFVKSLSYHNRAIDNNSSNAYAYYNRAKLHYEQSQLTETIEDLECAVRYGKDKSQARKFLVHAYTMAGDCAKAIELASNLLKDYSVDMTTRVNRAIAYTCVDNIKEAEQDNLRCIEIASENINNKRNEVKSYLWRAFAYANLKKIDEAKKDVGKLTRRDLNQANILIERIKRQLDVDLLKT